MEPIITDKIHAIEFRMLSPQLIKKMAVVKIVTPELYDNDGYPAEGGLMDLRLGVIDPGLRCKTCGGGIKDCPGHFGYIELARPVVHPKYAPWIYVSLKLTCRECGKFLLSEKEIEKTKKKLKEIELNYGELKKWEAIKKLWKKIGEVKKCPHCGAEQKKIKWVKPTTFYEEKNILTPIDIRERLERIPDEHLELLGIDPDAGRPEWMVLTVLPIPPINIRPSIILENGQRSEDDLTHKLGDIVRTNQRLWEHINAGAPEVIIEDLWDLLQYHVTTYIDNTISSIPPARHRSGRPLKTLSQRIRGKEGRFRHNLAGKRVNFSARAVISPDPSLDIDEVGVPYEVAMELTVPERVTEWNIEWLKKFVKNGPDKYPGANYVITPEGIRKKITEETKEAILEELSPGYIVERHLIDGDIAVFNRQPSLHRISMMAHRVRVLPGKTFRLNLCTTVPYNADFDGDEMNLHIPQTEEARAEAKLLLEVQNHIISPRYGKPIIGLKQDHISGNYLLTKEGVLSKEEASWLLAQIGIFDLPEPDLGDKWSGKQIFSVLLPKDLDYEDDYIKIKNGKIIEGFIHANHIGSEKGKLLLEIVKRYGNEFASEWMQKVAQLGLKYLEMHGISVLLSDSDLPKEVLNEIDKMIKKAENEVYRLIDLYEKGELEALPGMSVKDTLETKIMSILNRLRTEVGKFVEKNIKHSGTAVMAKSRAKGTFLNLALIAALVGQQAFRKGRINKGYEDRVLPHFKKNDLGPRAHGFVRHGYKEGLDPFELFFHAVTGRDSLMDKSLRTPKSGYLYRRLVNALQDLKVAYDGTVRDGNDMIVQFEYGEDGIDVWKSYEGEINIKEIVEKVIKNEA